jgi:hypothetical protein
MSTHVCDVTGCDADADADVCDATVIDGCSDDVTVITTVMRSMR